MHAIILFPSIIQQNIDRKGSLVVNFIQKKIAENWLFIGFYKNWTMLPVVNGHAKFSAIFWLKSSVTVGQTIMIVSTPLST